VHRDKAMAAIGRPNGAVCASVIAAMRFGFKGFFPIGKIIDADHAYRVLGSS